MREIEGEGGTWATRFYNYIIFFLMMFFQCILFNIII